MPNVLQILKTRDAKDNFLDKGVMCYMRLNSSSCCSFLVKKHFSILPPNSSSHIDYVLHFQAVTWITFVAVVLLTCGMSLLFEVFSSGHRNGTLTTPWSRHCLYLFGNIFNQGKK